MYKILLIKRERKSERVRENGGHVGGSQRERKKERGRRGREI